MHTTGNTVAEYQALKARAGRWLCGARTAQGTCNSIPAAVRLVADGDTLPADTLPQGWTWQEGEHVGETVPYCGRCTRRAARAREAFRAMVEQADADQWDRWSQDY